MQDWIYERPGHAQIILVRSPILNQLMGEVSKGEIDSNRSSVVLGNVMIK